MRPRPTLGEIEQLARQAGVIVRSGYGKYRQLERKGVIDLVTEVDRRAEAFLIDSIQLAYPWHRVVAEESAPGAQQGEQVWYIDPLDGTVNFAHGVPIFTVSVAYAEGGQIRLAAVYDPMQDECFTAAHGEGAWLNARPIQASRVADLTESLLVTGFPYDAWSNPDNNLTHYANFTLRTQGVRRLGSAALDLCYVAAGRLDGFWELRLNPWDVAAGGLIAQQAGAQVTALDGSPDFISPPCSILAANAALHASMLEVLNLPDGRPG